MQPSTGYVLSEIGQIALTVKDVDRAVAFYRDSLGLKLLFQAPPGLAFFQAGNIRLMLSKPEADGAHYSSILYFRTQGINGAAEALKRRGVRFEGEPHMIAKMPDHELWMAFFRDSESNMLGLMEELRR